MARALIVGCGCRGRGLGRALAAEGWQVRGTSRSAERLDGIAAAGIEPALADPDRVGTVVELVADVAVVVWALGSAVGPPSLLDALHGSRLESLLAHLVDTPVRGFVYEAVGSAGPQRLAASAELVERASQRWRVPVARVNADPDDPEGWVAAARTAAGDVLKLG